MYRTFNTSLLFTLAGLLILSGCQHGNGKLDGLEQKSMKVHPALNAEVINPAVEIMSKFIFLEESDIKVFIVPYSVDLMALSLLDKGKDYELVKRYMLWHLEHLNYPTDRLGLTATIYDYEIDLDLKETSTMDYDSSDSYSAMFLLLASEYYKRTGEENFFFENRDKLEDIAYNIAALMQEDGLTYAKADYKMKYLMDNSEVYGGLKAFSEICKTFYWDTAEYYGELAQNVKTGILKGLYGKDVIMHWAKDEHGKVHPSSWDTFYPDSYAQLLPIMHGVLDDFPEFELSLWENFNKRHKDEISKAEVVQQIVYYFARKKMEPEGFKPIETGVDTGNNSMES